MSGVWRQQKGIFLIFGGRYFDCSGTFKGWNICDPEFANSNTTHLLLLLPYCYYHYLGSFIEILLCCVTHQNFSFLLKITLSPSVRFTRLWLDWLGWNELSTYKSVIFLSYTLPKTLLTTTLLLFFYMLDNIAEWVEMWGVLFYFESLTKHYDVHFHFSYWWHVSKDLQLVTYNTKLRTFLDFWCWVNNYWLIRFVEANLFISVAIFCNI